MPCKFWHPWQPARNKTHPRPANITIPPIINNNITRIRYS